MIPTRIYGSSAYLHPLNTDKPEERPNSPTALSRAREIVNRYGNTSSEELHTRVRAYDERSWAGRVIGEIRHSGLASEIDLARSVLAERAASD